MNKLHKMLLTLLVIGIAGSLAGFGVFSAFSSTTTNSSNSFSTGGVTLADNDGGVAMFNAVTGGKPGTSVSRCIKVTYTGSLDADVRFWLSSGAAGALSPYIDLTIQPVTFAGAAPAFPDCTGAVNDGAALVTNTTLANFRDTKNSWNAGVIDFPGAGTKWTSVAPNNEVYYRVTYTVQDNNAAQGQTTGAHEFTWEARNQ